MVSAEWMINLENMSMNYELSSSSFSKVILMDLCMSVYNIEIMLCQRIK